MVITAPPLQLPKLCLHEFPLLTSDRQQSRDALQTSILLIFKDHLVNRLNQTGNEMMCLRANLVERYLCSIRQSIESLTRLGKDWAAVLLA